jgi:hypothetical protein
MSNGALNFSAVLGDTYQLKESDLVPGLEHHGITFKTLLVTLYAAGLVLCGIGAAIRDRTNSARILISLTAPWVLMFALLPQLMPRYLMWGAALCTVAVASSLRMSLLSLLTIALALVSIGHTMLDLDSSFWPRASAIIMPMWPGVGWMHLLLAAMYLSAAILPVRPVMPKA